MPSTVAERELAIVLSRRRALAIKAGLPLALAIVLVVGHAPTFWAGMLLTVLVAMVGAVGTAVSVSRARESGFLTRLAATPGSRPRLLGGWVLAATAVDVVQLLPVAFAVLLTGGGGPAEFVVLLIVLAATLLVTNVLGCLITLAAASAAEVLLDVVVLLAPLLYLGGLFTGVPATGWRGVAAAVDPFSHLHSAFIGALGGTATYSAGIDIVAALAAALVATGVLAALSRRVLERD
ncbi:MAG: ABC transporter permease [Candidatus Dormibacteraeota bacterium]|nr:ABC transporter permease [Candidatus Dormibacteraeota bacterium]